jgi:hypothetical protein
MATQAAMGGRTSGVGAGRPLPERRGFLESAPGAETRQLAREIGEFFQRENGALRAAAEELEAALLAASSSDYRRVQEAVAALRRLSGRFEAETRTRFRDEESVFFPLLEMKAPHLRGLVGELAAELERFRRALAEFRRELTVFNTTGELRHLPRLGRELARALRGCLDHEEQKLLPALLGNLSGGERSRLRDELPAFARV